MSLKSTLPSGDKLKLLVFLAAIDLFTFSVYGANLRYFHFAFILFILFDFVFVGNRRENYFRVRGDLFYTVKAIAFLFVMLCFHVVFVSQDRAGSTKSLILVFVNSFSCLYVFRIATHGRNVLLLPGVIKFNIVWVSCLVVLQFFLSVVGLYHPIKYGIEGIGAYGRPAALFDDPGWLAWWVGFLFIFYTVLSDKLGNRKDYLVVFVAFLSAILSGSRAQIILILFSFFGLSQKRDSYRVFFYIVLIVSILLALVFGLPENFYYDFVNLDRNPRLNDAYLIIAAVFDKGREWFGFGSGTLYLLNVDYEWRGFSTSNVFLLNVFYEYGFLGLLVFLALAVFVFNKLKTFEMKVVFVVLFFMLNFHNATQKVLFWVILGLLFSVDFTVASSRRK